MPQPVVAQTGEQWMRQTERRIGLLERRPAQVGDRFTNDGVLWTRTVPEAVPYITPTLTGFINYGGAYHGAGYVRSSAGIVVHTGLISNTGSNSNPYSVPVGYRPDGRVFTGTVNSSGIGALVVETSGGVSVAGAPTWASLAGLMYPAAGVATWTNITTFVNNFASYHLVDPSYPPAAFWMDQYGRVWFRGMIYRTAGGIPASDTVAFTLPSALAVEAQIHLPEYCNGGIAALHIVGNQFVVKASTTGVVYIGLSKCAYVASSVRPSSTFQKLRMTLSDWNNYGSTFPVGAIAVFPDGIAMMHGLINSGTIGPNGQACFTPDGISPDNAVGPANTGNDVYLAVASGVLARYDITRTQALASSPLSAVSPVSGAAGWRSLNGVNYMIGS